jgi:hypothetical protein
VRVAPIEPQKLGDLSSSHFAEETTTENQNYFASGLMSLQELQNSNSHFDEDSLPGVQNY